MEFKAERISKSSIIELDGTIENVFPLFGPVLEKEWAQRWDPEIIYSSGNLVEEHMIFITKSDHGPEKYFTWIVTQYLPEKYFVEYTVSAVQRVWFIRVMCKAVESKTQATISYNYTGFTQWAGDFNRAAMDKMFVRGLKDWEEAINYYLKNGKRLFN